jgi:hypothetical protein
VRIEQIGIGDLKFTRHRCTSLIFVWLTSFIAGILLLTCFPVGTLAEGQTTTTSIAEKGPTIARYLLEATIKKDPSQRSTVELNGAAEAAYLLYSASPNIARLEDFTTVLAKLWNDGKNHETEAVRLMAIITQFGNPTIQQAEYAAQFHHKDNSFFAFYYAHRLIQVGQFETASQVLADVDAMAKFSPEEGVGLLALTTMFKPYDPGADDGAYLVWSLYDRAKWIELPFLASLIHGAGLSHVGIANDLRRTITMRRIAAARSLLENSNLLANRNEGLDYIIDLRTEIEESKGSLLSDDYRLFKNEIEKATPYIELNRSLNREWADLRRLGLNNVVGRLIERGQVATIIDLSLPASQP